MDKKNLSSLVLFLIFLAALVIVLLTAFLQHKNSIGNAFSGGTHLHHTTGIIQNIDYEKKTIDVIDVDNSEDLFESDALHLECDFYHVNIYAYKTGEKIKFYFFLFEINGSNVVVSDIADPSD